MRRWVIGDIHGCATALRTLIPLLDLKPNDLVVTLGDYIDRGPDSKDVIEQLISLADACRLIPLTGNHELMLMRAFGGNDDLAHWLLNGGSATLQSYGHAWSADRHKLKQVIPHKHMRFITDCKSYHEEEEHIFVHANYDWHTPMDKQTENASFWNHIREHNVPKPHVSGKTVWVGHTPQPGTILDLGHVVCVDTNPRHHWLTAIDIDTREVCQANEKGEVQGAV